MARHKIDGETKAAAANRDEKLVSRAAKRTDWAGTALENAAGDLSDVGDNDNGHALEGLAEVVEDEAARVSRLAKDIESQLDEPDD